MLAAAHEGINMLIDNPEIKQRLEILLNNYQDTAARILKNAEIKNLPIVNEWKYSKGDLYNPIPYRSEMDGFRTPRSLNKKYESPEEASEKGYFASGFSNGQLKIIRSPRENQCNFVSISIYDENLFSELSNVYHIDFSINPPGKNLPRLNGYGHFSKKDDDTILNITVGRGKNYSINSIELKDGIPIRELAYASGWDNEVEYQFNHKNNELTNITTLAKEGGFAIVWNKN